MSTPKLAATLLRCTLEVVRQNAFLIIIPVFNVPDAWSAAKVAESKIRHSAGKAKLVTCVPIQHDYVCLFSLRASCKPELNFPVYEASSEREVRTN